MKLPNIHAAIVTDRLCNLGTSVKVSPLICPENPTVFFGLVVQAVLSPHNAIAAFVPAIVA